MPRFWYVVLLLIFVVPLFVLLAAAVWDVFRRRDMGVLGKGLWLVALVFFPFVGALIYLLIRPPGTTARERAAVEEAEKQAQGRVPKPREVGAQEIKPDSVREQRGGQVL